MNQLLFDRSTGALGPQAFARLQASELLYAIQPAPSFRFDGGDTAAALQENPGESIRETVESDESSKIWAHQAGVNALVVDSFEARL